MKSWGFHFYLTLLTWSGIFTRPIVWSMKHLYRWYGPCILSAPCINAADKCGETSKAAVPLVEGSSKSHFPSALPSFLHHHRAYFYRCDDWFLHGWMDLERETWLHSQTSTSSTEPEGESLPGATHWDWDADISFFYFLLFANSSCAQGRFYCECNGTPFLQLEGAKKTAIKPAMHVWLFVAADVRMKKRSLVHSDFTGGVLTHWNQYWFLGTDVQ